MSLEIEIEEFRERARRELTQIDETLHQAQAGAAIVQLDQTQIGRLSRMDAMQQQAMSSGLLERLRLQKRRLLAALDRMREDEYGMCCQCGDEIPLERLRADLAVPFCAVCQQHIDTKQKSA